MPEAQEVLINNEAESFRLTVALGITNVIAKVRVLSQSDSGHDVTLATRGDGVVVWVDGVCKRATTPEFDAVRQPFMDEAVAAWHSGEPIDVYNFAAQLLVAREVVRAAQIARREHDNEENRATLRDAENARMQAIYLALDRSDMIMSEIADKAGISLSKLYRVKGKRNS
jgi:hypothetical protein